MEWVIKGLLTIIVSILGFYVKRLYSRVDRNERDLIEHRVEDARNYITRAEHDEKLIHLKDDIRGMISPISKAVQNIENFLREHKK